MIHETSTHRDWKLFGPVGEDVDKMCFWEYARECRPLCDRIIALRRLVKNYLGLECPREVAFETFTRATNAKVLIDPLNALEHLRLPVSGSSNGRFLPSRDMPAPLTLQDQSSVHSREERSLYKERPKSEQLSSISVEKNNSFIAAWNRIYSEIDEIVHRFDWNFLISSDFPEQAWSNKDDKHMLGLERELFRKPIMPAITKSKIVKHGAKTRGIKVEVSPPILQFAGDLSEYHKNGDATVFNELNEQIAEMNQSSASRFHCFVIPDEYFVTYKSDELTRAFERHLKRNSRRQIVVNEFVDFTTTNCEVMVRYLGALRFGRLEKEVRIKARNAYNTAKTSGKASRDFAEATSATMYLGKRMAEHQKKAIRFFKELFSVGPDEIPRCAIKRVFTAHSSSP